MSAYAPMPRPVARRLWLAEVLSCAGIAIVMWAAGHMLSEVSVGE